MKILTWNVNGLRAVLGKGMWDWVEAQAADVVCLQEIKSRPEQVPGEYLNRLNRYRAFWNPAQRPGYSGVASFLHTDPLEVRIGLDLPEFDNEGRVLCTRLPDFLLFNVYFPSGQRDYGRVRYKLAFYARLLELCDSLQAAGERLVVCGDFNTAHQEIDLRNPRQNATTSGFLPEERAWIDRYLEHGFVDAFRALYPERVQYTWWTYRAGARQRNVGWRLDYFLVSANLMPQVCDVIVHDDVAGSDHCPVELVISDALPPLGPSSRAD